MFFDSYPEMKEEGIDFYSSNPNGHIKVLVPSQSKSSSSNEKKFDIVKGYGILESTSKYICTLVEDGSTSLILYSYSETHQLREIGYSFIKIPQYDIEYQIYHHTLARLLNSFPSTKLYNLFGDSLGNLNSKPYWKWVRDLTLSKEELGYYVRKLQRLNIFNCNFTNESCYNTVFLIEDKEYNKFLLWVKCHGRREVVVTPYVDLSTKDEISGIKDYMRVFSDKVLSTDEISSYYKGYCS